MRLQSFNRYHFSLIILFFVLTIESCKDNNNSYIPYVPVSFTVDLNIFNDLTTTGYSQLYENAGYSGVIVFCEFYDVVNPFNSIYHAYDAACTYEISDSCSILNEGNNVEAKCRCCGSRYSLFDGSPIDGLATISLQYYDVSILNNRLYISN